MSIPFTQYLTPDGRTRPVVFDASSDVEKRAHALIAQGCHFDIEMLRTGEVSMTCEKDEDCLSIEVCDNDKSVLAAVEKIINGAEIYLRAASVCAADEEVDHGFPY